MTILTIQAAQYWNQTSYQLVKGREYRFQASGEWMDWFISSPATGYELWYLKLINGQKRLPTAKWFSAIGAIDCQASTLFDLGKLIETGRTYTALTDGELCCFANDASWAYGNNRGSIDLTVESV